MSTSTSDARRAANQRNAQKSTGPKTEAGKANSRRNALTHGLTASLVDLADLGVAPRVDQPAGSGADSRLAADWLAEQVARTRNQISRVAGIEAKLRDQAVWRALMVWEEDRTLDAEVLGANLARRPTEVVARLRLTPHGCQWLIRRWGWLARAAETHPTGWTDEQTSLAFDLLGIPGAGRTGSVLDTVTAEAIDPPGTAPTLLDLARARISALQTQQESTFEADAIARALAEADAIDTPTPELSRLRRYEATLHRRLVWLLAELRGESRVSPGLVEPLESARSPEPSAPAHEPSPTPAAPIIPPAPNEARSNQTKPTPVSPEPDPGSDSPTSPTRNRPDLAKLARQDRRNQRNRQRRRQPA